MVPYCPQETISYNHYLYTHSFIQQISSPCYVTGIGDKPVNQPDKPSPGTLSGMCRRITMFPRK